MSNDKNAAKKAEMIARKKRVQRLKKMIVATIIIFLLLPSILCVALWIRLARFEKRYNDFLKTNEMQYAKMKKLEDEKEEKVEKEEKTIMNAVTGKAFTNKRKRFDKATREYRKNHQKNQISFVLLNPDNPAATEKQRYH